MLKKLFSCSTQLSMKFILLIDVKLPTNVRIVTFISMINRRFYTRDHFIPNLLNKLSESLINLL